MTFRIDVDTAAAGLPVVRLAGELDLSVYARVSAALQDLERDEPRPRAVIVDLRGLTFMDSTGVRVLAEAHRRAKRDGHRLAVVPGTGQPSRVIQLLRLDGHVEMVADPDELAGLEDAEERPAAS
jgi:anti-sigma B factor antagonist